MALIDVVIPVKGRVRLFEETLGSVLAQDLPAWRVWVVDDGSEPADLQAIRELCSHDPRITHLVNDGPRSGAPIARNLGLAAGSAPYVVFLDSDDLLSPTALSERYRALEARPDLDFVVSPTMVFQDAPGDVDCLQAPTRQERRDLVRFLMRDTPWMTTGPTWRREALSKIGGWDEEIGVWQDAVLSVKAVLHPLNYARIAGGLSHYRRGAPEGSISSERRTKKYLMSLADTFRRLYRMTKPETADREVREAHAALLFDCCQMMAAEGLSREALALWREFQGDERFGVGAAAFARVLLGFHDILSIRRIAKGLLYRATPSCRLPTISNFALHGNPMEAHRWEIPITGYAAPPTNVGFVDDKPRIPWLPVTKKSSTVGEFQKRTVAVGGR